MTRVLITGAAGNVAGQAIPALRDVHDLRLVRSANVTATDQVLRAARDTGARRVVIASSIHAMGGYARSGDVPVDPSWRTHPCCVYGASKVAAEALGHVYATRHGLPAAWVGHRVTEPGRRAGSLAQSA